MTRTSTSFVRASTARFSSTLLLVASTGCLSCGAMTKNLVEEATPAAVETGVETAAAPENQRKLVDAIQPELVEEATTKVASGSTDGLIEALSEEERQERLAAAMAPLVASLVDTTVNSALNDKNMGRIRELAKQATLGFQEAIDEVEQQKEDGTMPEDKGNVLEAANEVAEGGGTILYVLGALAAVLAVLLGVGAWWALRKKRGYEEETARRDREIEKITQMLAREGIEPGIGQEEEARENGGQEFMRKAISREEARNSHNAGSPTSKQSM